MPTRRPKPSRLVTIESPYRADTQAGIVRNITFARQICRIAVLHGYAPYASHLFYTQTGILEDSIPEERWLGMQAGLEWSSLSQEVWYCSRFGERMSLGMLEAFKRHVGEGLMVRSLQFVQDDAGMIASRSEQDAMWLASEVADKIAVPVGFREQARRCAAVEPLPFMRSDKFAYYEQPHAEVPSD